MFILCVVQVDLEEMNDGPSKETMSMLDFYKAQCQKSEQDMVDLLKKIEEVGALAYIYGTAIPPRLFTPLLPPLSYTCRRRCRRKSCMSPNGMCTNVRSLSRRCKEHSVMQTFFCTRSVPRYFACRLKTNS